MSGGVDSSAVAALAAPRAASRVVGLTMQLWNQRRLPELAPEGGATGRCCSLDDVYDARHVAAAPRHPLLRGQFRRAASSEQVVKPFVDDYLAGRTPIPCTLCNNFIKFDQFLEMAEGVGAAADRHRPLRAHRATTTTSGRWQMRRGVDHAKDQTYFLFGLKQDQLARTAVSAGRNDEAASARAGARAGHAVAAKPDSQEICFVPNGDYAAFIDAYFREQGIAPAATQGEIVDCRRPRARRARRRAPFHRRPAARAGRSPPASRFT